MNFNQARISANSIKEKELEVTLLHLIWVLEHKRTKQITNLNISISKELDFVQLIVMGYRDLYNEDTNSLEAYKRFSKGLLLAEELNEVYMIKVALMGMLDLLRREIFIGSTQFKYYLDYFGRLREDNTDAVILTFYEIVFQSKANESLALGDEYHRKIQSLDSLFSLLPQNHAYYPYYYHEKGIQNKIAGDFKAAESFYEKADSLARIDIKYEDLQQTNLWQLADLMRQEGRLDEARRYLRLCRDYSKGQRDVFYNDRLYASILQQEKKYDSAYHFLMKSINLEYTLGFKNNSLESAILAVENETEKLRLDSFRLDTKRKQNRNWLIVASIALILGTGIAILLQKNTTKKRLLAEQEAQLKQQRVENLLKEQELVSIDAMIEGQEKERQKVAGELHDDLGSLMATIKLHFDNAKVNKKDPSLQNAQKLLEEAYQKIRSIAHNKNSGVMSHQGLLPAINKMAQIISETNALDVTVEDFGLGDRLENSLELSIFRMIQELVANAIKHADATKVSIQITQHEDNLNIIIEDNGKGFDRSKLKKEQSGMGLTNIEKRVEHLEGNFTVDSVLGKGTSILIDIPV
nr:sensor histidine kinase [uncultured Allomuricauda sp.]